MYFCVVKQEHMSNQSISIQKSTTSNFDNVDFDNIPFGVTMADHMFICQYSNGEWNDPKIIPVQKLAIHPANLALHYGQSIFEGMKATVGKSGTPLLFRPEKHIERLNASARRMDMAEFPEQLFLDAVHSLVALEEKWIPQKEGSALYLRPLMFASDEFIGVKSSQSYTFLIFTMPVGPYYPKPVGLKVEEKYIRAADGGVGEAKTAGNYAASLYPSRMAKEEGYDQIMWMDAKEFKYVQEVGTMNIFFVIDGKVITPNLNGNILKGITRDCVLNILRSESYPVEERPISIDEIIEAHKAGTLQEVFGTGTAAVISEVDRIGFRGDDIHLNCDDYVISKKLKGIINGLRSEDLEDSYGWIVPVKMPVLS